MITSEYLDKLAQVESGKNPLAQNPKSSAKGLYQFIDSTGKQFGLDNVKFGTPEYTKAETKAVQQFTQQNFDFLKNKLGRNPTNGELYLAHQQGAGGAEKILSADPNARAVDVLGEDQVKLNGGNDTMTVAEFANKWTSKFDDIEAKQRGIEIGGEGEDIMMGEQGEDKIEIDFPEIDIEKELLRRGLINPQQAQKERENKLYSTIEIEEELKARGKLGLLEQAKADKSIKNIEEKLQYREDRERNLSGRIYNMALEREKKIQTSKLMAEQANIGYAGILPQLGNGAAFIGEAGFEIVKTGAEQISPQMVEMIGDGVGWAVSKVANTPPAKLVSREYGQFKEKHPLLAENIEGGISAGVFLSPVKIKTGKGELDTKIEKNVKQAQENAQKGIRPPMQIDQTQRAMQRILKSSDKSYQELLDELKNSDILTIADIAGDEIQGLTRSLGKMDGAKNIIHQTLTDRSESAVERVIEVLGRNVSEVDTYFGTIEEVTKARSAAAKPLYKKSYLEAPDIQDERLGKFLSDQRILDAISTAKTEYGVRVEVPNNSLEALDGAKKVLYDLESAAKRKGKKNLATAYGDLRRDMVKVLDDASPSYKKARGVFEHDSKMLNAQKSGRDFEKSRPEQLRKIADTMSADELEAYRIGVRDKLQEIVSKTSDGADPAKRIFGNTEKRNQLKAIFPDEKNYNEFSKRMNDEISSAKTKYRVIGGSRSDYNIATDVDFIDAATDAMRRGVLETAIEKTIDLTVGTIKKHYIGITDKNADELARILLDRESGIEALQKLLEKQKDFQQRAVVGNAIKNHAPMTMIDDTNVK